MRVLWVATKPPLPAVDGGCVVMARTLHALADAGVTGTLLAPAATAGECDLDGWRIVLVPAAARAKRVVHAWRAGGLAVARHVQPAVRDAVAALVARNAVDVVHAEQPFALPQCAPAAAHGVPIVLRVQNVEHEVLAARATGRLARALLAAEIRRLRAFEVRALRAVAVTTALTARDAERLARIAAGARVVSLAAPFPAELPAGPALDGAPAVVAFGSGSWFPNRRGVEWLVSVAWPVVRARMPGARLHVLGVPSAGEVDVIAHPAPADSAAAFAAGSILVVASRVATGVRMKMLEAWARGVPVVTTAEAATGLDGRPGEAFLVADDAHGFADAIERVHRDEALAARLRAGGRAVLRDRHDPADVARGLLRLYEAVTARATADPRPPAQAAW